MNTETIEPGTIKVQICIIAGSGGLATAISRAYAEELNIDTGGGIDEVMRVIEIIDPNRIIALRWPDDSWSDTDGGAIEERLARGLEAWYQTMLSPLSAMAPVGNA